ncbi:MAG: LptF/LptG family permease, partial [Candidatus Cloacimonetes bacterium]|nr:LptF/LptG family permease [Candidatus Cloacimonadota bacterium]
KPFFICFGITTFLFMFDRLSELMNTILEKQLDPLTIINLFALSLPFILALTVPMSVIYASIYAFGRMSVDNELTAAKATGIDIFKLTRLTMVFMIVMSFGMAYFNDFVLPESNHLLKRVLLKVAYKEPITAINPETFTTMNNLTIYAKDRTDEALHDILIYNLDNLRFPQTITAKKGEMYIDPHTDQLKVILHDGIIYERDIAEPFKFQVSKFGEYTFYREGLGFGSEDVTTDYRGDREKTSIQMREQIADKKAEIERLELERQTNHKKIQEMNIPEGKTDRAALSHLSQAEYDQYRQLQLMSNLRLSQKEELEKHIRIMTLEIHKKYSLAIACFILLMVGLPIGTMTKTGAMGSAFIFTSIIAVSYHTMLIFGEEMAIKGLIGPAFSMWFPLFLFLVISIFLIYIARKEKSINLLVVWIWCKKVTGKFWRQKKEKGITDENSR